MTECVEGKLQFVARVCGGNDRADARLIARHGGEADPLSEDPACEQAIRQRHGARSVADDHRSNWTFAHARVEPELCQTRLEKPGVLPQSIDEFRFFHEHVDGGNAGGGNGRRMRGGKQKRTRAVVQEVDERARPGDVAAERADRLRQRADLDVDPAMHAEMVDRAAAVATEDAARMRIIDHHDASEFLGKRAQIRQRAEVAVHAEHAVGNQQFTLAGWQRFAGFCGRQRRLCAGIP